MGNIWPKIYYIWVLHLQNSAIKYSLLARIPNSHHEMVSYSPHVLFWYFKQKKTLHTQANFLRNLYCMFLVLCRKFRYLETQNYSLFFKTWYYFFLIFSEESPWTEADMARSLLYLVSNDIGQKYPYYNWFLINYF